MIWNKFLAYQAEHNHKDKRLTLRIGYAINLVVSKLHSTSFSFMSFWSFERIQRKQSYKKQIQMKIVQPEEFVLFFILLFLSLSTFYIFVFNLWVELIYLKLFRFSARSIKSKSNTCTNVKQKPNYFWRQVFFENHREFKEDKKKQLSWESRREFKILNSNKMKWNERYILYTYTILVKATNAITNGFNPEKIQRFYMKFSTNNKIHYVLNRKPKNTEKKIKINK